MQPQLPQPDPLAAALSTKLKQVITSEIAAHHGVISFARYMELALYAPGLGYYNNGSIKLGKEGDFVTAPELSALFGQCLAKQCQQVLQALGKGDILELGPGTGKLAADILLALEQLDCLPEHYYLLELSPELKQRQLATLQAMVPHLLARVQWLERLPTTPWRGIILANEVMDAMPVQRFQLAAGKVQELGVSVENGELCWCLQAPSSVQLTEQAAQIKQHYLPRDTEYISELNLSLEPWLHSLQDCLQQGLILLIDYGFPRHEFYHAERSQGTLMCHYRQTAHSDPFWLPGLQDITAHVDFTAVAEAASSCDLDVAGYTHQAAFLLNCGLLDLAAQQTADLSRQFAVNQQIKYLTLPNEMGELFKVIALTRAFEQPLLGFYSQDRRHRL